MFSTFFAPRRNPVVPEMPGRIWPVEPGVHVGHHALPDTRAAVQIAEAARSRGVDFELGRGNFGVVYRVDTSAGPFAVKFPAYANIHGEPWSTADQIHNFKHEAGVSSVIARMGYADLMPNNRFVELHDGLVAIVREYGEPVTELSKAEFIRLEEMLTKLDRKHFWEPHDDLQLYRRPDGSIYVADVGFWHKSRKPSNHFHYLRLVAKEYMQRGIGEVPVLGELLHRAERIKRERRDAESDPPNSQTKMMSSWMAKDVKEAAAMIRKRDEYGLPVPAAVRKYVRALASR